jgi:hypothetical protein
MGPEQRLLSQCGVVAEGQTFPFWPSQNQRAAGPLRLRATGVTPHSPGVVARLGLDTELHVAPWKPSAPPGTLTPLPVAMAGGSAAAAGAVAVAAKVAAAAVESGSASRVGRSAPAGAAASGGAGAGVGAAAAAVVAVETAVPPSLLVVFRVQGTRGVVLAWPRRAKGLDTLAEVGYSIRPLLSQPQPLLSLKSTEIHLTCPSESADVELKYGRV